METFSGEFPSQMPVTQTFDVFFFQMESFSVSLAFVGPVTRKMFPFDDVIMELPPLL